MNQILVTEKIYVTPELKRKKKMYKILFILSIFTIISLFSVYIYAEYDRNEKESISQDILSHLEQEDDTLISSYDNALIVSITQEAAASAEQASEELPKTGIVTSKYTASDGNTYDIIGRINIPKIGVDYPIFSEFTPKLLKISVCRFHGGNPNEVGNLCVVGHNYRNEKFFSKVLTLQVGDIVEIQDLSKRTVQYEIYDIHEVDPNNRDDTTQKTNGKKEVTLVTCTNDSKRRVIVRCREKV